MTQYIYTKIEGNVLKCSLLVILLFQLYLTNVLASRKVTPLL